jgi:transposase
MALRLVITDAVWAELEPVLRALKHYAGSPPQLSDRMFIEAVLYQARTGIPWRDLPADFGNWDAVYNRFRRWEARQLWKRLWQHIQQNSCQLAKQVFIDSTIMRAHQHAAGAQKKTVGKRPRLLVALGADFPPSCMPPVRTKRPASACS